MAEPSEEDRDLAARLDDMRRELDQVRASLAIDSLHSDVYGDLTRATEALLQAVAKLLLSE